MKRVLLIITTTTLIGCIDSERYPLHHHGYSSNYSTVRPVYPRYEERYYNRAAPQRYVVPALPEPPHFRAYEEDRYQKKYNQRRYSQRENEDNEDNDEHPRFRR